MEYNEFKKHRGLIYARFWIGGIISGASNLVTGAVSTAVGASQAKKEREFNAEQAELNRQYQTSEREAVQEFDLDMWNMNNEYNSLSAQLQRAKEAGVSPNAILSGGVGQSIANPVSSTPMNGATASLNGSFAPTLSSIISNMGNSAADMAKTLADIDNIKEDTKGKEVKRGLDKQQFDFFEQTKAVREQIIKANLDNELGKYQDTLASVGVKNATRAQIEKMTDWIDRQEGAKLEVAFETANKLRTENSALVEQINNYRKTGELLDAQVGKTKAEESYIQQQEFESQARTELVGSQKNYVDEQTETEDNTQKLQQFEIAQNELKKAFCDATGMPYGVDQTEMYYRLWLAGEMEQFIMDVTKSSLKPTDKVVTTSKSINTPIVSLSGSSVKRLDDDNGKKRRGNRNPSVRSVVPLKHE